MRAHLATTLALALAGTVASATPAPAAQDAYRTLTVSELQFEEGALPHVERPFSAWELSGWPQPQVSCTGAVEAYLGIPYRSPWNDPDVTLGELEVSLRAAPGTRVEGVLQVPRPGRSGTTRHPFHVSMAAADPQGRADFLENRFLHYMWRYKRDLPGAAWFRHQAEATRRALAELGVEVAFDTDDTLRGFRGRTHGAQRAYELFSGGRALGENLALEEVLRPVGDEAGWIPIDQISGVTTREMDWAALTRDLDPELDPLAACIPHDQHALFFPSFGALVRVLDEVRANGAPVLELFDASSENAHTQERYERQLCLPLDAAARMLGGQLIESVAITGGDPYLRTGSDVAVILHARQPEVLEAFLIERQQHTSSTERAHSVQGTAGTLPWHGVVTDDRRISSYLMRMGTDVVVCNSLAQLERLSAVAAGELPALASLGEYVFFRDRYRRGTGEEDAFLVLSDATIRRLAGPRWRIGAARRTRAAAGLAERRAADLASTLAGGEPSVRGVPVAHLPVPGAGALVHADDGPRSEIYGSDRFLTPIGELDIDRVTPAERAAYDEFRTTYERRWRQVFDPIAARLVMREGHLDLDLSVVPLVVQTDYRELIELTRGATLAPDGGDPHEGTMMHFALALSRESRLFGQGGEFAKMFLPGVAEPLGWLGTDVSIFLEDDREFWGELEAAEDKDDFLEENMYRLPLGLRLPSTSPLRLAGFLTGMRALIEGSAPGLVRFETREHAERGYVAILPEDLREMAGQPIAIYYVSLPDGLVIALREEIVQRTIDRFQARNQGQSDAFVPRPWLGRSAALRIGPGFLGLFDAVLGQEWNRERQEMSWRALPILNEWRRMAGADVDPVAFHAEHWGVELRCPAGGSYVWNEEWQTFESSVFGHPAQPREGDRMPELLKEIRGVDLGVTFEQEGLQAHVRIERR